MGSVFARRPPNSLRERLRVPFEISVRTAMASSAGSSQKLVKDVMCALDRANAAGIASA